MWYRVDTLKQTVCAFVLTMVGASGAFAQNYQRTDLTADGSGAAHSDPNLVNAWGLSRSSGSPWWIADNGTGKSTLYDGTGLPNALVVTIPSVTDGKPGSPTGTISNGSTSFEVQPMLPAAFLFSTEDGTISAWNATVDRNNAMLKVKTPKAVYKGLTSAQIGTDQYLYVPNFHSGRVEVYDGAFQPVHFGHGAFQLDFDQDDFFQGRGAWTLCNSHDLDRSFLRDLAPFNIANIGGTLFIAYAKQDDQRHDDVPGAGLGLVAAFTPQGKLIRVFEHGDFLNAPWGLTLAPSDFGGFSHALLVGQFGSGEIAAYNIVTGQYIGSVLDPAGNKLLIDGLWALSFGNGGTAGPLNTLYFTAGPMEETHGLFGSLTAVAATQIKGNGL